MSIEEKNKRKALVLGCGASGLAAVRYLCRRDWSVSVADTRDKPAGLARLEQDCPGVLFLGSQMLEQWLDGVSLVMISPGLSPEHSAVAALVSEARRRSIDVVGEIELFARELERLRCCRHYQPKIIGITGTNGKTTTTTLCGLMVAAGGLSVCVAGNIGPNALSELDRHIQADTLPEVWVLELSSFQLDTTHSLVCTSAAFLNLTQDHVDWHGSMQKYAQAKQQIFTPSCARVLNRDDAATLEAAVPGAQVQTFGSDEPTEPGQWGLSQDAGVLWLSCVPWVAPSRSRRASLMSEPPEKMLLMPEQALKIRGRHNTMNALAALALTVAAGLELAPALRVLQTYSGEPHRVQFILKTRDIEFIDDSKGTNVGATVAALVGLGAGGQKCSIILGGDGKGQDFAPIAQAIAAHASHVVVIGQDAEKIRQALAGVDVPVISAGKDFEQAVELAYAAAQPGQAVLLSPACASWDMFDNYAQRSERFVAKAREIAAHNEEAAE